jgi:hypothetical protein
VGDGRGPRHNKRKNKKKTCVGKLSSGGGVLLSFWSPLFPTLLLLLIERVLDERRASQKAEDSQMYVIKIRELWRSGEWK